MIFKKRHYRGIYQQLRREEYNDKVRKPITQRQLRVGEMIKQALGMIFIRGEVCQILKLRNCNR